MKKIAIIGASYLQVPLIKKAKERGLETHVFAWETGDEGEKEADFFYPISIVEKEEILEKCKEIVIDGICSIGSDLAIITVNYVATSMNLISNSMECTMKSTNKSIMRKCFEENNDPSPKSIKVEDIHDLENVKLSYPIIVKPVDRSGSRGITKLVDKNGLELAIENAKKQGFEKAALVEEFAEGQEYSVEYISWEGVHKFLAITKKYTTGAPHFIETGHLEPAPMTEELKEQVKSVVEHALDSLEIKYGASHTELKVDEQGRIKLIEIGGRMGGDFIGSHLVELSTGNDFVNLVIDCALGMKPIVKECEKPNVVAVKFAFDDNDCSWIEEFVNANGNQVQTYNVERKYGEIVKDSASRWGYCLATFDTLEEVEGKFLFD